LTKFSVANHDFEAEFIAKTTLYTMNIKGLYSAFTVTSGAVTTATPAAAVASATGIKVSSGLFYTTADNSTWTVNTPASIADATPVYTIHTVSGTCTASTASAVGTLTNAAAVYVNWDSTSSSIVSVFVTYAD
jgi:hypothetical protein